jgi:hypothetical protein
MAMDKKKDSEQARYTNTSGQRGSSFLKLIREPVSTMEALCAEKSYRAVSLRGPAGATIVASGQTPRQEFFLTEINTMKRLFVCTSLLVAATLTLSAQQKPPASPPATESAAIAGKAITITYSSPGVKGRAGKLFGKDGRIGQDPTYPIWRAGANAATRLHTEADLDLGGLTVPKGDYTLYVDLSDPANWVLIVNKQAGQWGMNYDKAQDLGRVKMTMEKPPALVENLKYTIKALGGNKGSLSLAWENLCGSVAITVK